ncbi:branched-chain amino acid aminotransferase [Rhodoblastus sp.]|uniref:branched-chain amino acid aminotransferase n=1 Tax=Rhodoblastus sp. TaxID=1962975 RepID=UPI002615ECD1|nr:branched-chain amino acid aminotransferase [Rhodoblastus sp.]
MANVIRSCVDLSRTWTFFENEWSEGNTAIMGSRTHATWLASTVFDGARAFDGVTPDLDLHFARVNHSAEKMFLKPLVSVESWLGLAAEGMERFDRGAELYIRPMYWADGGVAGGVRFDPETTRWCLCLYESPLPAPKGIAITLSPFKRPTAETAPVEAKSGGLYANSSRAMIEAFRRGFDNCVMLDMLGNVAELANANIFMVKDDVVYTPAINGVFLDGITRRRVIGLLRDAGVIVVEAALTYADFQGADEIFSTGNFAKVAPVIRIDDRFLAAGPIFRMARELYWRFAHEGSGRETVRLYA